MKTLRVVNKTRGSDLGTRVTLADRWWSRARGFLGRPEPTRGEGLLMSPCQGVHMWGMSYPLDVVFLDRQGEVVGIHTELRPRKHAYHRRASYALELPAGTVQETGTQLRDHVVWTLSVGSDPANASSRGVES